VQVAIDLAHRQFKIILCANISRVHPEYMSKNFLLNCARTRKICPVLKIFLLVHQQNSSFLTVPSLKRNFCSSRGIILIYSSIPQGWKESLSGFISQKREQIPSQTLEQNGAGVRQTL
jgi:hypothetical protein